MLHLTDISHHRNGCTGVSFYVILFRDGLKDQRMAIKFDDQGDGNIYTAVLDTEKLADGDIDFGSNSFRGDVFDKQITEWCEKYEAERSAAADKENEREARAQATMRAFTEEEAARAA
jgi:hypothetical protein